MSILSFYCFVVCNNQWVDESFDFYVPHWKQLFFVLLKFAELDELYVGTHLVGFWLAVKFVSIFYFCRDPETGNGEPEATGMN